MGGRRLIAISVLAAAAIASLLVFGLPSSGSGPVGQRAPALPRERLAGPAVTLPRVLASAHGRPTLITFWASWCEPCEHEAGALERFSRSPTGSGRLIAVDWSDELAGARAFVAKHRWTFPVLRDAEGTAGNDYRITGLPTTFVLDGEGRISSVLRGPQTDATLARAIAGVKRS